MPRNQQNAQNLSSIALSLLQSERGILIRCCAAVSLSYFEQISAILRKGHAGVEEREREEREELFE